MFKKIKEKFKNRDESGAGLISLLGVSLLVSTLVISTTQLASYGALFTQNNTSNQQANSAAEAGINSAIYNYLQGTCKDRIATTDEPKYTFNVYHSTSNAQPPVLSDPSFAPGCPTQWDTWIGIEVIGYGKNNSYVKKEATFKLQSIESSYLPQTIAGKNINTKNTNVSTEPGAMFSNASIYSADGNIVCDSSKLQANIKQNNGTFTNACSINGNYDTNGSLSSSSTGTIDGDVCSTRATSESGVKGTVSNNQDACIKDATEFGYTPSYLVNPSSVPTIIMLKPEQCNSWSTFTSAVNSWDVRKDQIFDLRKCDTGMLFNSGVKRELNVRNDLTLIMDNINISNLTITQKPDDDQLRRVNLVKASADPLADSSTCFSGYNPLYPINDNWYYDGDPNSITDPGNLNRDEPGATGTVNNLKYKPGVYGVVYSPCGLNIKNSDIRGQVYSGGDLTMDSTNVLYMPTSLQLPVQNIKDTGHTPSVLRVKI